MSSDICLNFLLSRLSPSCKARLGSLECVRHGVTKRMETPGFLSYTRSGVVPYLTLDLAKNLPFDALAFTCGPLNGLIQAQSTLESNVLDKTDGIRDMIGGNENNKSVRPHFFLSTVADPVNNGGYIPGLSRSDAVSVFCVGGKVMVSLDDQFKVLNETKPDAFQIISDIDTEKGCPRKRLEKSFSRSVKFLNDTKDRYERCGKSIGLFATLVGGYSTDMRQKFATEVKQIESLCCG